MFDRLLTAFEDAFVLPESKSLLAKRWRTKNSAVGAPPSTGFCYIAAEAVYHILKDAGLEAKAYCASYEENGKSSTHWWVEVEDWIVDPTASQYTMVGEKPPYYLGRGKGFLTKKPSKRARQLIETVRQILGE